MIKHIVAWKLEENKIKNAEKIKQELEALKSKIEEIVEIEVGINFNETEAAYDVVLYSVFKTKEDLNAYQIHPKHQEVAKFVRSVAISRIVADYEI